MQAIFKAILYIRRSSSPGNPLTLDKFNARRTGKVLIVSCTAIGDTLFATPCIRAVRKQLPKAEIHFLVRDKFLDLFRTNPWIDQIRGYKGGYRGALKLLLGIKREDYDLCLIFHDSDPCPAEAAFAAGIPFIFRIGQKDERVARYLSCRIPYDRQKHAIDQRLEVVRRVFRIPLDKAADLRMELPAEPEISEGLWQELLAATGLSSEETTEKTIKETIRIGFQFSASGRYKMWPHENFVALGTRLLQASESYVICLLGAPEDRNAGEAIARAMGKMSGSEKRILNLTGRIKLSRFPEMIKGIQLLVSNDTGPLHVAIAVGTPTVSLFVPSNANATGPVQDLDIHRLIVREKPCVPCIEKYCGNPSCMGLITVDEVLRAALNILNAPGPQCGKAAGKGL